MRGHGPESNAVRAARTAASTSDADASEIVVSVSFVNGLITLNDLPPSPVRHLPPRSIGRGPASIQRGSVFPIACPPRPFDHHLASVNATSQSETGPPPRPTRSPGRGRAET